MVSLIRKALYLGAALLVIGFGVFGTMPAADAAPGDRTDTTGPGSLLETCISDVQPQESATFAVPEAMRAPKQDDVFPVAAGLAPTATEVITTLSLLVDDFVPQPLQGQSTFFYNRLDGDRGALGSTDLTWGQGQVTATITAGTWGGGWNSLNHPDSDQAPLNFSAILPPQIQPPYQTQITGLTVQIGQSTPGASFKVELKNGSTAAWQQSTALSGGAQTFSRNLPPLTDTTNLNWVIESAAPGDFVTVERIALTATTSTTGAAEAAFVWSYGMLLHNWDPASGLVRDKARDAAGEFDGIQSTGSLAAATVLAEQLGVVSHANAIQIVSQISDTLLAQTPRYHGLWPHFVELTPTSAITIEPGTEWSSIDTVIAAVALLEAQQALGLDTAGTEQLLQEIDWTDLATTTGIFHGYAYTGERLSGVWDTFGGESWLMALAYAAATGNITSLKYEGPPTANGSGFIDELSWLFVEPPAMDYWCTDWPSYRQQAAQTQIEYPCKYYPTSCLCKHGFFGLSAAEVPDPALVAAMDIYTAFGVGGREIAAVDGSSLYGVPVFVPHYSAMIASLRPTETITMWAKLINYGPLAALNNIESGMFPAGAASCQMPDLVWNHLKGSWNLTLQTLGWGRYLAERRGEVPILWQAAMSNPFLHDGYQLIAHQTLQADFVAVPTAGVAPAIITFTNTSTIGCQANSLWDFGDGITSTLPSPTHTYANAGSYTVTLTLTGPGETAALSRPNYIIVNAEVVTPAAVTIYGPATGIINRPYNFTATVTPPTATLPLTYSWSPPLDSGQGTASVTYTWSTTGAKTIAVTAAYSGGVVTDVHPITIDVPKIYLPIILKNWRLWDYTRESEFPDEYTVGQTVFRGGACQQRVHGQFGTTSYSPWPAKAGNVKYNGLDLPGANDLSLKLRYSKHSFSSEPINVYMDDELAPRATLVPTDQGDWNSFTCSVMSLGRIDGGLHAIRFETDGQTYGVADLDQFTLANYPLGTDCACR